MTHCYKLLVYWVLICLLCHLSWEVEAQEYFYQPQEFNLDPSFPQTPGLYGQIYNGQPYLITNVPTIFHGIQNVYATIHLPFVYDEWSVYHAEPTLFNANYSTGVVLASPRAPNLGLYAPVEIAGISNGQVYPYASVIPLDGNQNNYKGPFNKQLALNSSTANFISPLVDEHGISALADAQSFTRFTHEIFKDKNGNGWDGFDKNGNQPIRILISSEEFGKTGLVEGSIKIYKDFSANVLRLDRCAIGHEITHGILNFASGNGLLSQPRKEMEEAFCDIMGLSFRTWMQNEAFGVRDWNFWSELQFPGLQNSFFYNPKGYAAPAAYEGQYFHQFGDPAYNLHKNAAFVALVFYSVIEGNTLSMDGNPSSGTFTVQPLIDGDIQASYKLALQVFFKAFTEKLKNDVDYIDLRKATLDALIDFGYPPQSHAYAQLTTAWDAVNVHLKLFNVFCDDVEAESVFNGKVKFQSQSGTIQAFPQSRQVSVLLDCASPVAVNTYFQKVGDEMTDWDLDNVYSDDNNSVASRAAVSVHFFGKQARDWFNNQFSFDGMDGSGKFILENVIGDFNNVSQVFTVTPSGKFGTFYYPVKKESLCRDAISMLYFSGIDFLTKYGFPDVSQPSLTPEWNTIVKGLGQVFALEIKKNYEKSQLNPNADDIWTLNEDMSDPLFAKDFSNPKAYGQAALYHGINWDDAKPENNAGIINLLYYLLTNGAENGYINDELSNKTYFIHPLNKNLVLKVLWGSYHQVPANSSIEEFRGMTMKVLHDMDPKYYVGKKTKEHIAFYDAWAAVLGLSDFASTLKHFPDDGATVYPWTAKVGVEVEYPTYESERLFEVSKSISFDENIAPVHRFVSSAAPDLQTSMTYGYVALEPGQTYYVRSRLSLSGDPRKGGCDATEDPVFCASLAGKAKWTLTYNFKTHTVEEAKNLNPQAGSEIPAWVSPVSWKGVKGAEGYHVKVLDKSGQVPLQTLAVHRYYDEDQPLAQVDTILALAKQRSYQWSVVAWHHLGSEWEVHVLPNNMTYPFDEAEKANFPLVYGNWTESVDFKTDLPQIALKSPADNSTVSMIGSLSLIATDNKQADHYFYKFYFDGDSDNPYEMSQDKTKPTSDIVIQNLKLLDDQHVYGWTFAPMHKPAPPFIVQEEMGYLPARFHFKVDKSKIEKPVLPSIGCIDSGGDIQLSWSGVTGAAVYSFNVFNSLDNVNQTGVVVGATKTPPIANMRKFPGNYVYKIGAGVKNYKGEWIFGPEAIGEYKINPPVVTGLSPDNVIASFSAENSILFKWNNPGNLVTHEFTLSKRNDNNGLDQVTAPQLVSGSEFLVKNLEFSKNYEWKMTPLSSYGCSAPATSASFTSQEEPFIPLLGINVRTHDGQGAMLNSFKYAVMVTLPNGNVGMNHDGILSASPGVLYQPLSQFPNDGTLEPMDGWYNVHIEITDVLEKDPELTDGMPTWVMEVQSFNGAPALQPGGKPKHIDTLAGNGSLGGLTEGFSVDIPFHYNLKKLSK